MMTEPAMELAGVFEDWLTIWQSEMAGLVVDREVQEGLLRATELWALQARAIAGVVAPLLQAAPVEHAGGRAGADAAAGAAAADAAPDGGSDAGSRRDARDGVIARLLERVAELERRAGVPFPADGGAGPG